jgi:hypothetical protein
MKGYDKSGAQFFQFSFLFFVLGKCLEDSRAIKAVLGAKENQVLRVDQFAIGGRDSRL